MVKQAGDMMYIFTSLKMAFVPQLSHQMHIHCSLFDGQAMMPLPAESSVQPCRGDFHLVLLTSEGILPF